MFNVREELYYTHGFEFDGLHRRLVESSHRAASLICGLIVFGFFCLIQNGFDLPGVER